jgi:hypothetical protein
MKRDTLIWTLVMVAGLAALVGRAAFTRQGMGREYVHAVPVANGQWMQLEPATFGQYEAAARANPTQTDYRLSWPRSIGLWAAAFFTLGIFSFLYGDNPVYKVAEAVLVGVSAAYWIVVAFWDVIVPNLIGKLTPETIQRWAMPGLSGPDAMRDWWYLAPLILGGMLLWRLAPKGGWISQWPLAFIIGSFAGLQTIGFLHGDFLAQIRNTILPILVFNQGGFDPATSFKNLLIVVGVLSGVAYFFFSFEHRGALGGAAQVGIWFLMITFGASFGYTVMGRIALLAIRIEFLLDDWLWLIDPIHRRTAATLMSLVSSTWS